MKISSHQIVNPNYDHNGKYDSTSSLRADQTSCWRHSSARSAVRGIRTLTRLDGGKGKGMQSAWGRGIPSSLKSSVKNLPKPVQTSSLRMESCSDASIMSKKVSWGSALVTKSRTKDSGSNSISQVEKVKEEKESSQTRKVYTECHHLENNITAASGDHTGNGSLSTSKLPMERVGEIATLTAQANDQNSSKFQKNIEKNIQEVSLIDGAAKLLKPEFSNTEDSAERKCKGDDVWKFNQSNKLQSGFTPCPNQEFLLSSQREKDIIMDEAKRWCQLKRGGNNAVQHSTILCREDMTNDYSRNYIEKKCNLEKKIICNEKSVLTTSQKASDEISTQESARVPLKTIKISSNIEESKDLIDNDGKKGKIGKLKVEEQQQKILRQVALSRKRTNKLSNPNKPRVKSCNVGKRSIKPKSCKKEYACKPRTEGLLFRRDSATGFLVNADIREERVKECLTREKIKKKVLNKRRKKSNSRKGRNKGKNHKGKTINIKENPKNSCTGNNQSGFESISKPFSYSPIIDSINYLSSGSNIDNTKYLESQCNDEVESFDELVRFGTAYALPHDLFETDNEEESCH